MFQVAGLLNVFVHVYIIICYSEMSTAQRTKAKIRRQTAQPQELLFGKPKKDECDNNTPTQEQTGKQQDDNSMTKVPSAPGSLK